MQQLILAGNIDGADDVCEAEANRRVSAFQEKSKSLKGSPVDWQEVVAHLKNPQPGTTITGDTYRHLVGAVERLLGTAANRSGEAGSAPTAPQANDTSEAEAFARAMGWDGV